MYHKWQSMCDSWDTESNRQTFLSFCCIFCSFTPFTTSKIKVLKKMKKIPEDNIILHLFTTNDNHMIYDLRYGVWQTEFFAILDYFLPFYTPPPPPPPRYLLTTQKIKILKKWTIGDIIIIILIISCMVPKIWSATDRIFSHVWPFFAQLTPNNPENQKFEKMEKTHGDIIILSVP